MTAQLNHTIVPARDMHVSARFLAEILGLPDPRPFGPFLEVRLDNDVTLDFQSTDDDFPIMHYAFLVSEETFTAAFGRIRAQGVDHWADPGGGRPGEINTRDGGRGVYFADPDGHHLEILTRPYGSGS